MALVRIGRLPRSRLSFTSTSARLKILNDDNSLGTCHNGILWRTTRIPLWSASSSFREQIAAQWSGKRILAALTAQKVNPTKKLSLPAGRQMALPSSVCTSEFSLPKVKKGSGIKNDGPLNDPYRNGQNTSGYGSTDCEGGDQCKPRWGRRLLLLILGTVGGSAALGVYTYQSNTLHYHSIQSDVEAIRCLMSSKEFDLGQRGSWWCPLVGGMIPVHIAASFGRVQVTKYLLDADPETMTVKTCSGMNLLHCASAGGNVNLVKYLIDTKNFDVAERDNDVRLPMHVAAMHGRLGIVRYYIEEKDINPNLPDKDGCNVLHLAAGRGALDLVTYLVEKNYVPVDATDKRGRTALDYAKGCCQTKKYIQERKAVREYLETLEISIS